MVGVSSATYKKVGADAKSTTIKSMEEGAVIVKESLDDKKMKVCFFNFGSKEGKGISNLSVFRCFMLYVFYTGAFFLAILTTITMFEIVRGGKYYGESGTSVLTYTGKSRYIVWPDPPPHQDLAAVARYVMHISEWGSLATNSTHKGIEGYPFVNVFSVSDGPVNNATGVPYFYLTPMELSVIDLKKSKKVSFTVSEAQSNYCNKMGYDPEDPRCAHIIFTGLMEKIEKGSKEESFAKNALFSRHEEMKNWPSGHDWFFAKLNIVHIYVLDFFGGVGVVSLDDYFAANPFDMK